MTATALQKGPQLYEPAALNPSSLDTLKKTLDPNLRFIQTSILQLNQAVIALGARVGGSGGSSTVIVTNADAFFRLNGSIELVGGVTSEQPFFTSEGSGSRNIPPTWWAAGRRLLLVIPLHYELASGAVTIQVKVGATAVFSYQFTQPEDLGFLLLSLGINDVTGTVVTMSRVNEWQSTFDQIPPSAGFPADAGIDTTGIAQTLQITATFTNVSASNKAKIRNVEFYGMKAPIPLT